MGSVESKLKKLPDDIKEEVEDYIDFLMQKKMGKKRKNSLEFKWSGAMKGAFKDKSAVDIQHAIQGWRIENETG